MQLQSLVSMGLVVAGTLSLGVSAAPVTNFPRFVLKTVVTAGNTDKNNLYLTSYHTGAGMADAVLTTVKPTVPLFLNNTAIQFDYGKTVSGLTYLNLQGDTNYASWDYATINQVDGPTNGFYFNNTASKVDGLGSGLKWNPGYPSQAPPNNATSTFGGWLGE